MLDWVGEPNAAALVGLFGGILLGLAARIGRFCTLGAIEDYLYGGSGDRLRMWGVAIGIAITGASVAEFFGVFDGQASLYLSTNWNPLATVIGGLLFGYGMALSGNCGYGVLARFGGGDLRAFVILIVMGLSAYVFLSGPLAEIRVWLFPVAPNDGGVQSFVQLLGAAGVPTLITGLGIGSAILIFACSSREFAKSPMMIFWGMIVGCAILTGWLGTYWIAQTGFGNEPIETHSFTVPIGDTIFYGMTASGNALSFSVGSVMGVISGAMIGSFSQGHFRWEACEDPRELKRQILGAALMGPGAVLAMGCSVGQGISAFSVLSFSAPVAFLAIFAGAALGLRQLITGFRPVT